MVTRVDRYDLLGLLGQGSFGSVHRARHVHTGQEVAIKIASGVVDPDAAARILSEGRAASLLRHANVVTVLDSGIAEGGETFVVMELLEGETLAQLLTREGGTIPLARAMFLASQLLGALEAAHRLDVIHRDVKPSNIFVLPGDHLKVIDFGISKLRADVTGALHLTLPGIAMGTPGFMAPEQVGDARSVDARADLYAAGATIYQCLSGRKPIDAEDFETWIRKIRDESAPLLRSLVPNVPPAIADVVDRALAKDRDARWPSAAAMRAALREAYDRSFSPPELALDTVREPPRAIDPGPSRPLRNAGLAWFFALFGVVLALVAIVVLGVLVGIRR